MSKYSVLPFQDIDSGNPLSHFNNIREYALYYKDIKNTPATNQSNRRN